MDEKILGYAVLVNVGLAYILDQNTRLHFDELSFSIQVSSSFYCTQHSCLE